MKINQNNYEVFFIDYYDGTLSAEQSAELFLFLECHPELKAEFDNFSNIQLEIPELQYPGRDSLKREGAVLSGIDQQLIASLEGDCSLEEKRALESLIQSNPKHKRDAELFKATVSVPDLSVVFPDKKSLKKPAPFFAVYRNEIRYGIAAMLLLAFVAGMVSMFNRTMEQKTIQVAEEKSVVKSSGEFQSGRPDTAGRPVADSQIQNLPIEKIKQSAKQPTAGINVPEKKSGQINKQFHKPDNEMPVVTEVPVQLAEAVPANPLPLIQENLPAEAQSLTGITQLPVANSGEQYLTVWEALQQSSEKNLKKLVAKENPVLAYADDTEDSKPTLVDIVSKGLEKVSNDKVKLDADKQSRRYSFSAGNFKIEKR